MGIPTTEPLQHDPRESTLPFPSCRIRSLFRLVVLVAVLSLGVDVTHQLGVQVSGATRIQKFKTSFFSQVRFMGDLFISPRSIKKQIFFLHGVLLLQGLSDGG